MKVRTSDAAFQRRVEVEARRVNVTAQDGTVILSGNLHSWAERREAEPGVPTNGETRKWTNSWTSVRRSRYLVLVFDGCPIYSNDCRNPETVEPLEANKDVHLEGEEGTYGHVHCRKFGTGETD